MFEVQRCMKKLFLSFHGVRIYISHAGEDEQPGAVLNPSVLSNRYFSLRLRRIHAHKTHRNKQKQGIFKYMRLNVRASVASPSQTKNSFSVSVTHSSCSDASALLCLHVSAVILGKLNSQGKK